MWYEVAATGARLTLGNAQLLLNNYVAKLPADRCTQGGNNSFLARHYVVVHDFLVGLPSWDACCLLGGSVMWYSYIAHIC